MAGLRIGVALASIVLSLTCVCAAGASGPRKGDAYAQSVRRLTNLAKGLAAVDRRVAEVPQLNSTARLRAAITTWQAAATDYARLAARARLGRRGAPPNEPALRVAWALFLGSAAHSQLLMTYTADMFTSALHGGAAAKEGLAAGSLTDDRLRARLRVALARLAA